MLDNPHAVVERIVTTTGAALPPDWALQVRADYVAVLNAAVPATVADAGIDPADVIGIGFTVCTMAPTLADGTPLNELPDYTDRHTLTSS